MIPRLANRTPRTRAVRGNTGDPRLESLAAEFALLAQRRSRAVHQIETLDQQRATAALGFARLQKRITWLMERMNALSADPADPAALEPEQTHQYPAHQQPGNQPSGPQRMAQQYQAQQYPSPQHAAVTRPVKPAAAGHGNDALAAIGRKWAATHPAATDHHTPPRRIRRP
jgi:hypothetical protein